MSRVLIASVAVEGGIWQMPPDPKHPIRLYSDRRIEDDIVKAWNGKRTRERMTRSNYRFICRFLKSGESAPWE